MLVDAGVDAGAQRSAANLGPSKGRTALAALGRACLGGEGEGLQRPRSSSVLRRLPLLLLLLRLPVSARATATVRRARADPSGKSVRPSTTAPPPPSSSSAIHTRPFAHPSPTPCCSRVQRATARPRALLDSFRGYTAVPLHVSLPCAPARRAPPTHSPHPSPCLDLIPGADIGRPRRATFWPPAAADSCWLFPAIVEPVHPLPRADSLPRYQPSQAS
jgi:hypothetical protein